VGTGVSPAQAEQSSAALSATTFPLTLVIPNRLQSVRNLLFLTITEKQIPRFARNDKPQKASATFGIETSVRTPLGAIR
jgi:hypothetical protein